MIFRLSDPELRFAEVCELNESLIDLVPFNFMCHVPQTNCVD